MRRLALFVALTFVAAGVSVAEAQPTPLLQPDASAPPASAPDASAQAPAPQAAPSQPITVAEDEVFWKEQYDEARSLLVAGEFATAARKFAHLEETAPNDGDRMLAREQRELAVTWMRQGVVLRSEAPPPPARPRAKASVNQRSTDELAGLYLAATLYGIGTGVWVAVATQANSAAGALLPPIAFSGVTLGAVGILDSGQKLHYGAPQATISGMYIGLEEGIIWSVWNKERAGDHWQDSTVSTVIWGFSTAGLVTGALVGELAPMTPGRASFVGSAALWTAALAGFGSGAIDPDESIRKNSAWLAAGVGLNAGAIAGIVAAVPVSPSIARVRFLDLGAVAGGTLLGATYFGVAGSSVDGRLASGAIGLGIAGGLVGAWFATAKMAPDFHREGATARAAAAPPPVFNLHPTILPAPGGGMLGLEGQLL